MNTRSLLPVGWLYIALLSTPIFAERELNGFTIKNPLVPENEIFRGGPPRDGIPAIDAPKFISTHRADYLDKYDRVLGVSLNGITKAYPINIMNYHELVNDDFNGQAVVISFCPLCGTGIAFDAKLGKKTLDFGVSGLLYNSDLLMYDRQTHSLWSQVEGKSINGAAKGIRLKTLPIDHTTWKAWRAKHPDTQVLSKDTGFWRDYSRTPYPGYGESESLYFPISNEDGRYHPKDIVLGVEIAGQFKAYPLRELAKHQGKTGGVKKGQLEDSFADVQLTIDYDNEARSAQVKDSKGKVLPSFTAFWFAWMSFHPKSEVYQAE